MNVKFIPLISSRFVLKLLINYCLSHNLFASRLVILIDALGREDPPKISGFLVVESLRLDNPLSGSYFFRPFFPFVKKIVLI